MPDIENDGGPMKKQLLSTLLLLFVTASVFAQIQVPVSYDLGVGKSLEGIITGGSICEPEGLSVTVDKATAPSILPYEQIDKIAKLTLDASGLLSMDVTMRDGQTFKAATKVSDTEPMIILRDEAGPNAPVTGPKTRTFSKAGFRGIALIEFEAALPADLDVDEVKKLTDDLNKALEDGDLDKAIDAYNKIGEILEKADTDSSGAGTQK